MSRLKYLVIVWTLVTAGIAYADEDKCHDMLKDGIFNVRVSMSAEQASHALHYAFCASDFNQAQELYDKQQSSGHATSLSGDLIDVFKVDGRGNDTSASQDRQNKFYQWKNNKCGEHDAQSATAASNFVLLKTADSAIVSGFKACMLGKEGLSCWAEPQGEDFITLQISWKRASNTPAKVIDSKVYVAAKDQGTLLTQGTELQGGWSTSIPRPPDASVIVNLTVRHDGHTFPCNIYVPKPIIITPGQSAPPAREPPPVLANWMPNTSFNFPNTVLPVCTCMHITKGPWPPVKTVGGMWPPTEEVRVRNKCPLAMRTMIGRESQAFIPGAADPFPAPLTGRTFAEATLAPDQELAGSVGLHFAYRVYAQGCPAENAVLNGQPGQSSWTTFVYPDEAMRRNP